jgi:hypothetical protein
MSVSAHPDEGNAPLRLAVPLLLGCYALGLNLHNIIHEFGHSVAVLVQGGEVTGYRFHPFDGCLNFSTYVPDHVLLYAGGAFIGGAATILFPVLAWKRRTPGVMPLVLACAAGLVTTAHWMLRAPWSDVFTDYTAMIELGVPWPVFLGTGTLYLAIGVAVLVLYLPLLGMAHDAGLGRRLALFELGILPYHLAAVAHGWVRAGGPARFPVPLVVTAAFLALWALLSRRLQARWPFFRSVAPARLRPAHVARVWLGVVVLLAAMLLIPLAPPPA